MECAMVTIADGEWIADIKAKTCTHFIKKIVVTFEKSGNAYLGKINDMPIELMSEWAEKPSGERYLIQAVEDAEKVYIRAMAETSFENQMGKNSGEIQ
jgi:hypothetical protein